jgi:hypothetical protein
VRIARAKGCEPRHADAERYNEWFCDCVHPIRDGHYLKAHSDDTTIEFAPKPGFRGRETHAWLTPAGAFVLLAEMVEAEGSSVRAIGQRDPTGYWSEWALRRARKGPDSLPLAIAAAWLASPLAGGAG